MTDTTHADGRTSDQIERELAQDRGRIAETAEALQARVGDALSMDGAMQTMADEAAGLARAVSRQVRENPLPAAMIGAGVAMLLLGGRRIAAAGDSADDLDADEHFDDEVVALDYPDAPQGSVTRRSGRGADVAAGAADDGLRTVPLISEGQGGAPADRAQHDGAQDDDTGGLRDRAGAALRSAGAARDHAARRASGAARAARRRAGEAADEVATRAQSARRRAGAATRDVRRQAGSAFEAHPLLVGALAFAAGAAIGGLTPNTTVENRAMGRPAQRARSAGAAMAREGAQTARAAARAGAQEAADIGRETVDAARATGAAARDGVDRAGDRAAQAVRRVGDAARSEAAGADR